MHLQHSTAAVAAAIAAAKRPWDYVCWIRIMSDIKKDNRNK